jgi:hypothetical protein
MSDCFCSKGYSCHERGARIGETSSSEVCCNTLGAIFLKPTYALVASGPTTSSKGTVSLNSVTCLWERTTQTTHSSRHFRNFEIVACVLAIYHSLHPNVIRQQASAVTGWLGTNTTMSSTGGERISWINLLSTGFWLKESLVLKALPYKAHH